MDPPSIWKRNWIITSNTCSSNVTTDCTSSKNCRPCLKLDSGTAETHYGKTKTYTLWQTSRLLTCICVQLQLLRPTPTTNSKPHTLQHCQHGCPSATVNASLLPACTFSHSPNEPFPSLSWAVCRPSGVAVINRERRPRKWFAVAVWNQPTSYEYD